eukprot:6213024-Pleurochrysis_carterae.AAC.15
MATTVHALCGAMLTRRTVRTSAAPRSGSWMSPLCLLVVLLRPLILCQFSAHAAAAALDAEITLISVAATATRLRRVSWNRTPSYYSSKPVLKMEWFLERRHGPYRHTPRPRLRESRDNTELLFKAACWQIL